MSDLEVRGLDKSYRNQSVLQNLDLTVKEGTFVSILGPSGSGKTTLLRVIAGFDRADQGAIRLGANIVDDATHFVEPDRRRIGYVPQDGSLFPHLSVVANVGFGLSRRERHGKKVVELLEMVGLGGLAERYPHQLSGGQQQRVALARGLAIDPDLVLLDEPFSSLDASLRASVRHDVRLVLKESGATAILVTHDQDEALSLADQVAIMHNGRISQCDSPAELYAHPSTPELAKELGEVNFLSGRARQGSVETAMGILQLGESTPQRALSEGEELIVLIRPEQLVLSSDLADARATAHVLHTEFFGHDAVVTVRADWDEATVLIARTPHAMDLPFVDSRVALGVQGSVIAWRA
ncbi:MAG TPA: ABC transporter ATP-binding protein [Acidimicrobiales bacterium]|nr:ABC transporter ATP-binding protein [Acidimicrobiales bacterium]